MPPFLLEVKRMALEEVIPSCNNCFWFEVDFDKGYFCTHPKFKQKLPLDLDLIVTRTYCGNMEGWQPKDEL